MRTFRINEIKMKLKNIAVYCGSSEGTESIYKDQAELLGKTLAENNVTLVYGGAQIGIMGIVADAVMQNGSKTIGVIPKFLCSKEVAHTGLTELIITESMHDRKLKMLELSDAMIALPGGFGTMEELFEVLTWAQLGLHTKPIGILNVDRYYDDLIKLVENMNTKGFLKSEHRDMLIISNNVDELLDKLEEYVAPPVPKWITNTEQS
jgi:uncharacterized protein (TIGR00730 family)